MLRGLNDCAAVSRWPAGRFKPGYHLDAKTSAIIPARKTTSAKASSARSFETFLFSFYDAIYSNASSLLQHIFVFIFIYITPSLAPSSFRSHWVRRSHSRNSNTPTSRSRACSKTISPPTFRSDVITLYTRVESHA